MKSNKFLAFGAVLVLAFFATAFMRVAETKDSPERAVIEFTQAYYGFDGAMADRMSRESLEKYSVDDFLWEARKNAEESGFSLFYMKNKPYSIETQVKKDEEKIFVTIGFGRKAPLRSFFTKEELIEEHAVFEVIQEDGKWKVAGDLYSLPLKGDEEGEEDEDA